MLKPLFLATAIMSCMVSQANAENIRTKDYSYAYGDSVAAMAQDAFIVCGDCQIDKLEKLPKQYERTKGDGTKGDVAALLL